MFRCCVFCVVVFWLCCVSRLSLCWFVIWFGLFCVGRVWLVGCVECGGWLVCCVWLSSLLVWCCLLVFWRCLFC